jgi:hypothetical protein
MGASTLANRIRVLNAASPRPSGGYVLYWAQMNRRVTSNHALAHAGEIANANNLPLLVYEGLTYNYKAANDRHHTFVLEGVPETGDELALIGAGYFFYLRANASGPNDVLYRLAARAHLVSFPSRRLQFPQDSGLFWVPFLPASLP